MKIVREEGPGRSQGFDYCTLSPDAAGKARASADRIRERLRRTLEDIIQVGFDLAKVKAVLGHGSFYRWLADEFGWTERTAENYMAVAERFGSNSEIISDLTILPTAAYLLARPSVPQEARDAAVRRARKGELITLARAQEIVAASRIQEESSQVGVEQLEPKLANALERYRQRWNPKDASRFVAFLREFADAVERKMKELN